MCVNKVVHTYAKYHARFEYPPAPTPRKRSSTGGKPDFKVIEDDNSSYLNSNIYASVDYFVTMLMKVMCLGSSRSTSKGTKCRRK